MTYEDALDRAISLAHDQPALDDFVATLPRWSQRLRGDVALVRATRSMIRPGSEHRDAAWRQIQPVLTAAANPKSDEKLPLVAWIRANALVFGRASLAAAVAVAAIVAVLVVTNGRDLPAGERLVFEARVVEAQPGVLRVRSNDAIQTVNYTTAAVLVDGFGNPVRPDWLQKGQPVQLTSRRGSEALIAERIELRGILFGMVTAIDTESVHVTAGARSYVVELSGATKIVGAIGVGSVVEVEIDVLPDGKLYASEVETAGAEDEDDPDNSSGASFN